MAFTQPYTKSSLIMDEELCFILKSHSQGMTLTTVTNKVLFQLDEPVLLAQGTIGNNQQIHLAYIKNSSELCYTIISPTGEQQTMPLGKVDTYTQRFDSLYIFPLGKVIHIFYASSHITLPDVWRITHLFWNGQAWKSAQLGEIVHPHRPLFQVLMDSRANLHVLMLTYLGSRSVLLTSVFNGSFHLWSKRQEVLRIPRQVVDMTAIISETDQAFLFWAARQPSSDGFEIGQASQKKVTDFKLAWNFERSVATDLQGPWLGIGAIETQGKINLFAQGKQAILFNQEYAGWIPQEVLNKQSPLLSISQKGRTLHYTLWGQSENILPLFAQYLGIPNPNREEALSSMEESLPSVEGLPSMEDSLSSTVESLSTKKNSLSTTKDSLSIRQESLSSMGGSLKTKDTFGENPNLLGKEISELKPESKKDTRSVPVPEVEKVASHERVPDEEAVLSEEGAVVDEEEAVVPEEGPLVAEEGAVVPEEGSIVAEEEAIETKKTPEPIETAVSEVVVQLNEEIISLNDPNRSSELITLLQELIKTNQKNAQLLQEIVHKINSPTRYQVSEKKGFWQRWFT